MAEESVGELPIFCGMVEPGEEDGWWRSLNYVTDGASDMAVDGGETGETVGQYSSWCGFLGDVNYM